MTPHDLATERDYRIQERIGISCGGNEPSMEETMLAKLSATNDVKAIENHLAKIKDCEEAVKDWK